MLFYIFLKFLTRIGLNVFFRKKIVNHSNRLPSEGPIILAVNHPNTLMDVLMVAAHTNQRVGFLANAPLFENPYVDRLLSYLHAIPVARKQDLKKGESMNNRSSFEKCIEYLESGGTLMIFPEGSSYSEMKLRKLKTGLARIALEFGEKYNFEKDLTIVPFGLNYSDPLHFRSDIILNIGEPISIKDHAVVFGKSQAKAVRAINKDLKWRFEEQLILLNDKPQEKLFKDLLSIFPHPDSHDIFAYQQKLARELKDLQTANNQDYLNIESTNQAYQQIRQKLKISEKRQESPNYQLILSSLFLLLLFPIFLFGAVINTLPAYLCKILALKTTKEIEYWAVLKMLYGIFLFTLWYLGISIGLYWTELLLSWQAFLFGIILPLSGIFTIFYVETYQKIRVGIKLKWLEKRGSNQFKKLKELGMEIKNMMQYG